MVLPLKKPVLKVPELLSVMDKLRQDLLPVGHTAWTQKTFCYIGLPLTIPTTSCYLHFLRKSGHQLWKRIQLFWSSLSTKYSLKDERNKTKQNHKFNFFPIFFALEARPWKALQISPWLSDGLLKGNLASISWWHSSSPIVRPQGERTESSDQEQPPVCQTWEWTTMEDLSASYKA